MKSTHDISFLSGKVFRAFAILFTSAVLIGIISIQCLASDKVVKYSIGTVDPRFSLSRTEVSAVIHQAVALWETGVGQTIFKEDLDGDLRINFVYDERQAISDNLKKISDTIDDAKASYDEFMAQYEEMKVKVDLEKDAYSSDYVSYLNNLNAYKAEIHAANQKQWISKEESQSLEDKKHAVESELSDLQAKQFDLQKTVAEFNNIVSVIDEIAANHNSQVMNLKNVSKNLNGKFEAGRYEKNIYGEESISIYHFKDHNTLVRTLAHELGHVKGLKHNAHPDSIMYYLNQSDCIKLTLEDVDAMKSKCNENVCVSSRGETQ